MKPGQIVEIYEDPVTRLKPEGKARLIKPLGSNGVAFVNGKRYNMESWLVSFLEDYGEKYERAINVEVI